METLREVDPTITIGGMSMGWIVDSIDKNENLHSILDKLGGTLGGDNITNLVIAAVLAALIAGGVLIWTKSDSEPQHPYAGRETETDTPIILKDGLNKMNILKVRKRDFEKTKKNVRFCEDNEERKDCRSLTTTIGGSSQFAFLTLAVLIVLMMIVVCIIKNLNSVNRLYITCHDLRRRTCVHVRGY